MCTKHSTSSMIGKLFLWNSWGERNRGIKVHQKAVGSHWPGFCILQSHLPALTPTNGEVMLNGVHD
jgi:hypothetical protein